MITQSVSKKFLQSLSTQFSNRLLGVSFIPLHFSIWNNDDIAFSKTLLLLHIGLFLLWQPYLNHKTQIRTNPSIILLLSLFGIIYLGGLWVQAIWVVFLIGILSSYRFSHFSDKLAFYTTIIFLLIELFGGLVPSTILSAASLSYDLKQVSNITAGLCILLLIIPFKTDSIRNYAVDLLYSVIAISIIILIAMTSAIWMAYGDYDYFTSLIYTCITLAGVLIMFSLIFKPSSGLGMLSHFKDRYLLNLGTPFETFLIDTATLSTQTENPEDFLEQSFEQLNKLDWVNGFHWNIDNTKHAVGDTIANPHLFSFDKLSVTLYSSQKLGPSMLLHARLLIQIISIFYSLKNREIELAKQAHMEAIHETGARITHDIKNLLQSLNMVLSSMQAEQSAEISLPARNIKLITDRLQKILIKLRNPNHKPETLLPLDVWWRELKARLAQKKITITGEINENLEIPGDAFDAIVDNLIDNAEKKRIREPEIDVSITILADAKNLQITVTDTGTMIDNEITKTLLNDRVKSSSGYGIGLYQANKQVEIYGYQLSLSNNQNGSVSFTLCHSK